MSAFEPEPRPHGHGTYQVFPDLNREQFEELKADIEANGVITPIEFDTEGNIIDGHQRMKVILDLGITDYPIVTRSYASDEEKWQRVLALNMHRRHLTRTEKDRVIKEMLVKFPHWSSRQIARAVQVAPSTVIEKREELVAHGVQIEQRAQADEQASRREAVLQAVAEHPHLPTRAIAKVVTDAGISTSEALVRKVIKERDKPTKKGKAKLTKPVKTQSERQFERQLDALKKVYARATVEVQQAFRDFLSGA